MFLYPSWFGTVRHVSVTRPVPAPPRARPKKYAIRGPVEAQTDLPKMGGIRVSRIHDAGARCPILAQVRRIDRYSAAIGVALRSLLYAALRVRTTSAQRPHTVRANTNPMRTQTRAGRQVLRTRKSSVEYTVRGARTGASPRIPLTRVSRSPAHPQPYVYCTLRARVGCLPLWRRTCVGNAIPERSPTQRTAAAAGLASSSSSTSA